MECSKCKKELKEGDNAYILSQVTLTNRGTDYEREADVACYCIDCVPPEA